MSMKFLALNNELIANFAADNKEYNLGVFHFHIIQYAEVADSELKFRERIWPQPLDCMRKQCGLKS